MASKEQVLDVLSEMSVRFRSQLGESLATVEKHNKPLDEATTSSLDALKAYSTGLEVVSSTGEEAAVPFFYKFIEIDPQFSSASAELCVFYGVFCYLAFSA